jgi:hypothetical protein
MRTTSIIRRVTALLLLPLLVVLMGSEARAYYRCPGDAIVRVSCCCPKAHDHAARRADSAPPAIAAACCCSIVKVAAVDAPSAQLQDRDTVLVAHAGPPGFGVALPAPTVATVVVRIPDPRAQLAPPRTTASLYSQRIALLV